MNFYLIFEPYKYKGKRLQQLTGWKIGSFKKLKQKKESLKKELVSLPTEKRDTWHPHQSAVCWHRRPAPLLLFYSCTSKIYFTISLFSHASYVTTTLFGTNSISRENFLHTPYYLTVEFIFWKRNYIASSGKNSKFVILGNTKNSI